MRFHHFRRWIEIEINKKAITMVCLWYIISLMIDTRKNSLIFASEISGMNKASFCKFLRNDRGKAVYALEDLSKKQARKYSRALESLNSLPWKAAIVIDATFQNRASEKTENSQRFYRGRGYSIGHRWTNIIILFNNSIIPLKPIPFYSRKYCRDKNIEYKTEHERIVEYFNDFRLEEYIGKHSPKDLVVLADSGYDDRKIQKIFISKKWDFVVCLKSTRSVKSSVRAAKTPKSKGWIQIDRFFKNQRRLAWKNVCVPAKGSKKKRKDFRARHTDGFLRDVDKPVLLVCSELKKRTGGKRKYFACTRIDVDPKIVLIAYGFRWRIEVFNKEIKQHFGFQDVAAKSFDSVVSHVHWVCCAYILLQARPPGVPESARTILEKQRSVAKILQTREKACFLQLLTRIGGTESCKNQLKKALMDI